MSIYGIFWELFYFSQGSNFVLIYALKYTCIMLILMSKLGNLKMFIVAPGGLNIFMSSRNLNDA